MISITIYTFLNFHVFWTDRQPRLYTPTTRSKNSLDENDNKRGKGKEDKLSSLFSTSDETLFSENRDEPRRQMKLNLKSSDTFQ